MVDSQYYLPNDIGISALDCREAFRLLSPQEKMYAHYLSRAAWYGGLVVLLQTSPESANIFVLLQRIFRKQTPDQLEQVAKAAGVSSEDYQAFLVYAAGVYANMGNYKSFGDTKFIPNLPKDKLEALVRASQAFQENPTEMEALWGSSSCLIYSLEDRQKQLGLGDKGITTYFSGNCCLEDAELAQRFLDSRKLSAYNTRLFKRENGGKPCYEVRLASAVQKDCAVDGEAGSSCGSFTFEDKEFIVKRGDYSPLMEKVCHYLQEAQAYAANDNQKKMLEEYRRSFEFGSIEAHKEGSRFWIKDKGPIVESYIGFIESYRDPFGSRGEFEGFVAVVNKAMSERFARLVSSAEVLLPELPWPQQFEKDTFLKPDFTSLDVLTFAGSGIPAGINIPNYDDIRQSEGFKNVSLGNVLAVAYATQKEKLTFLEEKDKDLFIKWKGPSFEVQVGLHELLGHGSGKLFVQDDRGKFNFDQSNVVNPETGEKVSSWYRGSETWDSKFSTIASSYEECRAECVGLYLCLNKQVLSIFGHEAQEAEDVVYINWLSMVRAGLLGLEFYTPESKSWRQAHMQARFVILRVLLEAGEGLVGLEEVEGQDGKPDARITLDRSKISTVGKDAIHRFLCKLQVFKSTADVEGGRALYEGYSTVGDTGAHNFLRLRETVLLRKEARKMFVQANTRISGNKLEFGDRHMNQTGGENVELVEYESSAAGLIRSFTERFQDDAEQLEAVLLDLNKTDACYWC
ncbi:dipeptidyl peptidase 3 [Poecilia latipinna]|uniref:Dipeptidyl peptidase 3 n=2 Tax=Poecilia TaxID=8080 RepID=A0A087XGK4_POEFO|nr:PREDICTED: dipeptidyl peptidase 3 [Poecilia formosa]XP_007553177.1 PREDICTED: dipeptidyl peptidase 3 [Poecilia formosa]XP_014878547.1 PREDICTED: dipeptidyl peptidase 3 [Poecilia latipinna]XP_014878553.1 PREDICTED: dipeptidyl peptidase 3 [Poecilia latipinna]XP_014878560.1 PREDICTED: dipeptidyl peptidase 3 [Poecilia latipinna]XP_016527684.1 PREDICTED: dipeptidyl peptidase 3 [Poecilia formosa]